MSAGGPFDPEDTDWGRKVNKENEQRDRRADTNERHHVENLQSIGEIRLEIINLRGEMSTFSQRIDNVQLENNANALAIAENTALTKLTWSSTEWIRQFLKSAETGAEAVAKVCRSLVWFGGWVRRLMWPLIYIGGALWIGIEWWKGHSLREAVAEFIRLVGPK